MSRQAAFLPAFYAENMDTSAYGETISKDVIEKMRDACRDEFEPEGLYVSDIGTWSVGTMVGAVFEIHDPANNCSLYMAYGYSTSTTAPDIDDYMGLNTTNLNTRFHRAQGLPSASISSSAGHFVWYNPDTTVARADLDFDNATTLRYTGGDWTTLTTIDPDSLAGIQALVPAHCPLGICHETWPWVSQAVVRDSVEGVFLHALVTDTMSNTFTLFGPIIDPASGTNEYGTAHMYSPSGGDRWNDEFYAYCSAFDAGGTIRYYDISPDNDLTTSNYKIVGGPDDGKLNWKKVELNNGSDASGVKGYLKEEYCVEIGIYDNQSFRFRPIKFPDAANPVVCYTRAMALFWPNGARLWPTYSIYDYDGYA